MENKDWANYLDAAAGQSKPWLILNLLYGQGSHIAPDIYATKLGPLHQAPIDWGAWWQGQQAPLYRTEELFSRES